MLLLTLQGTIPISFRGATYNIPVAYWIPHAYPREAPIAYVVPAANMLVRQSQDVDLSGLIKTDFLRAWTRKWEVSYCSYLDGCIWPYDPYSSRSMQGNNLLLLTETLQGIFSREPPLYAKPAQHQHQHQYNGYTSGPSTATAGPSQPPRQAGPRPPPPPPTSSSTVAPDPNATQSQLYSQSPNPISAYADRQGSLSPSHNNQPPQQHGQAGPPSRPEKPWVNGRTTTMSPNGAHHRSASLSSVRQAPSAGPSTQPSQHVAQPQGPPRPPMPYGHEHNRSASTGQRMPDRQPSLHVQTTPSQQPRSPPPISYQAHQSQSLQQAPHSYAPQSPASPQSAQPPYRPEMPYFSGPQASIDPQSHHQQQQHLQAPFEQQPPQPRPGHQVPIPFSQSRPQDRQSSPSSAPNPYIPPRPDGFRSAASPSTAKAAQPHRLATPVNILDDDDEPAQGKSSTAAQPPPPRPTNPALLNLRRALYAQLVHHLHTLQSHLNNENEHLRTLHNDLLKGEPAILDEMQRLEAVRDVCVSVRDRMEDVVGSAQRNIEDLSTRPETEVDELICGTNVVHNQYVASFMLLSRL